ncbi:MAG: NUDIX hydrolase, partial [Clostridia bacterium]
MKNEHIIGLLNEYSKRYPLEEVQVKEFKKLILNSNCFDYDNKIGHITASCFIIDLSNRYGLLTHHRKINKWLQLGGHINSLDKTIHESAQREAFEESSLSSLTLVSEKIFDIDIHKIYNKDLS